MKKIYILTLLLCFISFGNSFAQTLKGHIYDAKTNEPLVGAAVTYKLQGNQGVVSDINGAYEIELAVDTQVGGNGGDVTMFL